MEIIIKLFVHSMNARCYPLKILLAKTNPYIEEKLTDWAVEKEHTLQGKMWT